jgi:uncharacterized repeat protein (TIGR01451 family)
LLIALVLMAALLAINVGSLNTSASKGTGARRAAGTQPAPPSGQKPAPPSGQKQGTQSVAGVLNDDGSVKPGISGSFDVSGFRMEYGPNGAPRFVAEPMIPVCTPDWDTQFGRPNGVDNVVQALAVTGSDLYVGGQFTLAGNVAANRVAKFNTTTNTWSALSNGNGNGVDGPEVLALAVIGSDLYVGGYFTTANVGGSGGTPAVSVNNIAKFNTTASTWSALSNVNGNGVDAVVFALAVIGSDLYVGGSFTSANVGGSGGTPAFTANYIAKFNTTASTWSALSNGNGIGVDSEVNALAVIGSDLYVGGQFTIANVGGSGGTPAFTANRVAKFNTTTSVWSGLSNGDGNGVYDTVYALAVIGSDLYVGGGFQSANVGGSGGTPAVTANRVAKFNTTTSVWSGLSNGDGNGVDNNVLALAVIGSDLYVGGSFTSANVGGSGGTPAVPVNQIAKFDTTASTWSALSNGNGNGVSLPVLALAVIGSDLYVGGSFTSANVGGSGGTPAVSVNNIAKFNTTASTWSALSNVNGNGVDAVVFALAVIGSDLYVGGDFTLAGNVAANRVAKFNTTTNTWSALSNVNGNGVDNVVLALAVIGSDLYVGGQFTSANVGGSGGTPAVPVNHIAKFNTTASVWSALSNVNGNGVNGTVNALTVIGSDLYVGGQFNSANVGGSGGTPAVTANYIAKFDTTASVWSALSNVNGNGVDGTVQALAVIGSDLYVGGSFTSANVGGSGGTPAVPVNHIAKFNTTASVWSALSNVNGNGVDSNVLALAVIGSDLYVGGSFTIANVGGSGGTPAVPVNNIAKFDTTASVWSALSNVNGNGVDISVRALAVIGSDLYVGGEFTTANVGGSGGTPAVTANRVAKFNTTTNTWSALSNVNGNGVDNSVFALAVIGSDLYVGGGFTTAGGNPSLRLARWSTCNTPPTITAAGPLTRQQGSAASNSQIATVNDTESGAGGVTVTATTVPTGISVTGIVNNAGTVTANVAADCTAATGDNTVVLTATDGNGATATANLIVNVTANTAPTLTYSSPQSVAFNGSLDVTPTTATDNGSITGYSVFSVSPALTTPPTVDSSGKVTITNAQPPGSHVITIQATDNCSATTNAAFTLNVPSPATMSGTKTVSGTFAPNGAITYTVVLSNSGPAAQLDNPGDEFSDVLPSGLTLVSASATSGTAVATVGSNTVTWNGSIPASSSVTITIHATINSNAGASTISNQGTISYDADGNGTNEASALTDDPSVGGASDATSFFACGNSIVVTANGNSGAGSLRQAILDACPGATITFDVTVTSPITVSSELVINKNLTIQGPTSSGLTISGNNASRVFNINAGMSLAISNLTIDSGRAAFGGGIYNQGALILTSSTISNNKTTDGSDTTDATNGGNSGDGGGIYSTGTLTLINSTISGNKTGRGGDASGTGNGGNSGNGAGIYHTGALTLTNTTVTKNQTGRVGAPVSPNTTGIPGSTVGTGGGISRSGGTLILNNTIVADNRDGFSDPDDINGTVDSASASNLIGSSAGFNGISNGTNGNQIGQSAVPLSPQLGALADNGGPTKTHLPQQLSPAIDAGSNALAKDQSNNPLTSDQRGPGFDRILNGTVEIGAVEVNYGPAGTSADVGVTKSSSADSALPDTNVTYTITVSNNGPNVATNATLTDALPAAMTFVSLSSPGGWLCTTPSVGTNGTVTCTNATLPLTVGAVFTLVVHIIPGATPGNFITNQAQVATSAFDANNENDSSAASTLIVGANADLGVTKLASADTSPADRDVLYTITVTNGGPAAAANVALNDTLPGNMTFVSLSSPAGWSCASHPAVGAGGTVTCTNPSLAVTSGQVFTLVGHIPSGTSNGTFYFNQATVSSSTSDPNPDNNSSPAGTTVVACVTDPVVTTNADSGAGSLRQVIIDACDGSTINFDMTQVVSPITLTSAELAINKNLTIQGPGANLLTVQRSTAGGPPKFRIFNIQSGTVNISGLTISNGDNAANGGAITNLGALTLNGLTLSNNHTSADGSAIFNSSVGTVALSNSTLSGNQSEVSAAVYNQGGAFTITNSTLTGNTNTNLGNASGVAIFSESNSVTNVTNCTISKNTGQAEAVYQNVGGSGQVNLKNSIVSGNTGGDVSGITDNGNNVIGGNPLLAPLGNYGGPTQTMALLPGSPAINAGTSTGAPATDQRGISRVGAVDIGAFESRGFTISATSGNAQSTPILTAFGAPLVATVGSAFSEPVAAGMVIFTAPGSGASATFTGGVTTFNATINGGGQATATPTANGTAGGPYNVAATANGISSTATFSLTNQKANQTITFGALANKTFGDPDFGVSATASSGLPVSFAALGNCTVSGSTVHLTGGGSCTVTASQGGDSNYNAAANVPQSFTIAKGNQTITFGALVNKTFGDPDFGVSATASSGLAVSFAALGNCTVSGSTVHLTGGGSCTVTASQGGDSNYNAAANVPQSFTIAKAATTTALSSSINPSDIGQNVTFTATVSAGVGTPTGTVQFKDGANNLGGAINCVAGGGNTCTAQVSSSTLTTGPHTITAIYSGDTNFSGSTGTLSGGQVVTNQQALLLILDQSGPDPNQAAAFDALLLLRDPFHVQSVASWWNFGPAPDRNTRVMVFVANLQLNQGETAAAVVVNLIDSNSLSYDVAAEDIRLDPITGFAQVTFRLPDTLFPGTCTLTVKAHGHVSNSATMRIAP